MTLSSTVELEGIGDPVNTYGAMLHEVHIRASIPDLVDPPLAPFSI